MSDTGDDFTSGLKQKVGPLPLGVWIMAVGAGIAIAWYMRRNAAPAVPTGTESQDFTQGGNTDTPSGAGNLGSSGVAPLPSAPADNDEWLQRATDALLAKGGTSPAVVSAALSAWLGGESLDDQERAIVDMAIRAVGNPPVAPPPAANKPPNPPVVPPRHIPPMPGTPGKVPKPTKPGPPVRPHLESQAIDTAGARATLAVTSVRGATAYIWRVNGQQANTTPSPRVTLTHLPRRTRVTVTVQPQNVAGTGPQSGGLSFTTK